MQEAAVALADFQSIKERIKQAIDIVDLVGRYIPLRRQGRLFVGLCPWHDDTHPSLQVDPQRQTFRCWVCNIGGDIFSFLMRIEGLEFREAFKSLADRAGISFRPPSPNVGAKPSGAPPQVSKSALLEVLTWAEKKYHECLLAGAQGEVPRQYLADRGIASDMVVKFRLGFSPPEPDWIVREARRQKIDIALLIAAGIVGRSSTGALFDRFCGRVLFPIHDVQNRPISFGGRILPEKYGITPRIPFGLQAKYLNGPETPVFAKSRMLYGLGQAWQAITRAGRAIVVEGYTDCILAHQFGFPETVAVLGTAFGDLHLRLLQRYTNQVVLLLDGDEAGRQRAAELLELFIAADVDLRVATLPGETDPADFLTEFGAEALRDLLAHRAIDAFEHARRVFVGEHPPEDLAARHRVLERLLRTIAASPILRSEENQLREALLLQRLGQHFGISEEALRQRVALLRRQSPGRRLSSRSSGPPRSGGRTLSGKALTAPLPPGDREEIPARWQRELLEILFMDPTLIEEAARAVPPERIRYPVYREIYRAMCMLARSGETVNLDRLLLHFEDPEYHSVLVCLEEDASRKKLENPREALEAFLAVFHMRLTEEEIPKETKKLESGELSEEEQLLLLQHIVALRRKK